MRKILPGQKAKVYIDKRRAAFGEVLGIDMSNKVILATRPDFNTLRTCDIDQFFEQREVQFLSAETAPIQLFIQWQPK